MEEEQFYLAIGNSITNSEESKLFGKPCFKVNKKAFVCFFENCMVFKLTGEFYQEALSFDGSFLFDPSKKGRPMKEWVQIPYNYKKYWNKFASEASKYVSSL